MSERHTSAIPSRKCGVVVLSYNSKGPLYQCLASVFRQTCEDKLVIVVDNSSDDDTPKMVREFFPDAILIENDQNTGTAATNLGVKLAISRMCEYIMLVDSDAVMDDHVASTLVEFLEKHPDVGIAGPSLYEIGGMNSAPVVRINPESGLLRIETFVNRASETDCIGMAMIRKDVFDRIGLIDPVYFAYYQDTDFSLRARRVGYKVFILPEAKCHHLGAYGTRRVPGLRGFVGIRNRCILIRRNYPPRFRLSLLGALPVELAKVLGQWFASHEMREVQCALLGTIGGIMFLVGGREPRILRRIAVSLMGYRISMQ